MDSQKSAHLQCLSVVIVSATNANTTCITYINNVFLISFPQVIQDLIICNFGKKGLEEMLKLSTTVGEGHTISSNPSFLRLFDHSGFLFCMVVS